MNRQHFYIPPDLQDGYRHFTKDKRVASVDDKVVDTSYGQGALGMEIDRRLSVLDNTEAELRAQSMIPEGWTARSWDLMDVETYRKGLMGLRSSYPDAILSPEHVYALSGVGMVIDFLQLTMMWIHPDLVESIDWKQDLQVLRAEAVKRLEEWARLQSDQQRRVLGGLRPRATR